MEYDPLDQTFWLRLQVKAANQANVRRAAARQVGDEQAIGACDAEILAILDEVRLRADVEAIRMAHLAWKITGVYEHPALETT